MQADDGAVIVLSFLWAATAGCACWLAFVLAGVAFGTAHLAAGSPAFFATLVASGLVTLIVWRGPLVARTKGVASALARVALVVPASVLLGAAWLLVVYLGLRALELLRP